MGHLRFTGIRRSRAWSVVPVRETASLTSVSSPRRFIIGTRPLVLTVTRRVEKLGPSTETRMSSARFTSK